MTADTDFAAAHAEWFETRMSKLTAEDGWLNLLGRWWITPGTWTIGSGEGNDVVLPLGPQRVGTLTLTDGDSGRFVTSGGEEMPLDRAAGRFSWRTDRFAMEITSLNDLRALRIRDIQSENAARLAPIPFFDLDPALRITARWEPLPKPISLTLDTIIGVPTEVPVSHVARFEFAGREMSMLPTYGTADRPQFVFRDLTSLDDTYAHMRFVFGEDVTEDGVVIDFNRATNPPCAFTSHAVCPLPPRENLFGVRIEAGEKRVRSGSDAGA
ncbi:DUF1684 domain-containing protein [Tropicimonas sp. IMCC34011]|uniref:DUF1684 domain-containing protein n=1 Tax=Tropicimonas sp. IMCC34011 TaxID=2248759 RepID=UPI000E27E603|nr:DUF1684 domain-containing protein [Tropicimonas sp. IMCC34011]